jgi:hypothetical protein
VSNDQESADPPGPSVDEWRRDHFLVVRRAGHCDVGVRPTLTRVLLSPGGTTMRVETRPPCQCELRHSGLGNR